MLNLLKREFKVVAGPLPSIDASVLTGKPQQVKKEVEGVKAKISELEDVAARALPDALVAHVTTWNVQFDHCNEERSERYVDDRHDSPTSGELLTFKDVFLASRALEILISRLIVSKEVNNNNGNNNNNNGNNNEVEVLQSRAFINGLLPQLLSHVLLGPPSVHSAISQTLQDIAPRTKGRQLAHVLRGAIVDIIKTLKVHPERPRLEQRNEELGVKFLTLRSQIDPFVKITGRNRIRRGGGGANGGNNGENNNNNNGLERKSVDDGEGGSSFLTVSSFLQDDNNSSEASNKQTNNNNNNNNTKDENKPLDFDSLLTTGRKLAMLMDVGDEHRRVLAQLFSVRMPDIRHIRTTFATTGRDMETLSYCLSDSKKAAMAKMELVHRLRDKSILDRDESLSELERLEQIVMKEEHRLVDHLSDLKAQMRLTKHAIIELEKQRRQLEEDRMITARKYESQLRKLHRMEYNLTAFVRFKQADQEAVASVNSLTEWCLPVLEGEAVAVSEARSAPPLCSSEALVLTENYLDKAAAVVTESLAENEYSFAAASPPPITTIRPAKLQELENASKRLVSQMESLLQRYDDFARPAEEEGGEGGEGGEEGAELLQQEQQQKQEQEEGKKQIKKEEEEADIDMELARLAASAEALTHAIAQAMTRIEEKKEQKEKNDEVVVVSPPPMSKMGAVAGGGFGDS